MYEKTSDEEEIAVHMADVVESVGEVTAERVVSNFDSIKELFEADMDDIMEIEGVGESRAEAVLYFTTPLNTDLSNSR